MVLQRISFVSSTVARSDHSLVNTYKYHIAQIILSLSNLWSLDYGGQKDDEEIIGIELL